MIGRRVNLPTRAGGGIGVIRDVSGPCRNQPWSASTRYPAAPSSRQRRVDGWGWKRLYFAQVQANLCFVDREISEEDEGWEGLDARITCNRDELSYVDEDAAE